jgi:hypothetical protein
MTVPTGTQKYESRAFPIVGKARLFRLAAQGGQDRQVHSSCILPYSSVSPMSLTGGVRPGIVM